MRQVDKRYSIRQEINFSYSCSEKINRINRYCNTCKKHVNDIRGLKEDEVKQLLEENNGSICASFSQEQFSFINNVSEPLSLKWKKYVAATIFSSSLLGAVKISAQVQVDYNIYQTDSLKLLSIDTCGHDSMITRYSNKKRNEQIVRTEVKNRCNNKTIQINYTNNQRLLRLFRIRKTIFSLKASFPFIYIYKKEDVYLGRLFRI